MRKVEPGRRMFFHRSFNNPSGGRVPPPSTTPLTPAEQRVLAYVCAGYSNKEIASFLGKAEPTVKHQVSACLRKFGLSSRMRLMAALR